MNTGGSCDYCWYLSFFGFVRPSQLSRKSRNSLKLSFTNIRGLRSKFVKSYLEPYDPDILVLCETNLDDWIYSGSLCVTGYLPPIRKDCTIHMHGLAVYVKEGLPFPRDLSLENSEFLLSVFDWLYFTQCLISFSSVNHLLRPYVQFWFYFM